MTDFIFHLLDEYIKINGKEDDFWDMTIKSIEREFEGYNFRETRRLKEEASMSYNQAMLIIQGVGICLGSKQKMPSLYESYPELFKEEAEKEKLARETATIHNFMNSFNKKFSERNG